MSRSGQLENDGSRSHRVRISHVCQSLTLRGSQQSVREHVSVHFVLPSAGAGRGSGDRKRERRNRKPQPLETNAGQTPTFEPQTEPPNLRVGQANHGNDSTAPGSAGNESCSYAFTRCAIRLPQPAPIGLRHLLARAALAPAKAFQQPPDCLWDILQGNGIPVLPAHLALGVQTVGACARH
eukprot:3281629-Rhodomonas_salina.1